MEMDDKTQLPSFIEFKTDLHEINFYGRNSTEAQKTYKFLLEVIVPKTGVTEANPWSFDVEVFLNTPPEFSKKLEDVVLNEATLTAGDL